MNQITFYNLQSHLTYWHFKIFILIHTICESLVKIQSSRHDAHQLCKRNKIKMHYIICPICQIYFVKVWWSYMLPSTNAIHFCDFIFKNRAALPKCSKNSIKNFKKMLHRLLHRFTIKVDKNWLDLQLFYEYFSI